MKRATVSSLVVLLSMLSFVGSTLADGGVLLIVEAGDAALASKLGDATARALGRSKISRDARALKILREHPSLAQVAAQAKALIIAAENAALHMEKKSALGKSQRALQLLERAHLRRIHPTLVARAEVARAFSAMLAPSDKLTAQRAFRAALDADANIRPDQRRLSPRISAALNAARALPPSPTRPTLAGCKGLARRTGTSRLIWIVAQEEPGKIAITIFDTSRSSPLRRELGEGNAAGIASSFAIAKAPLVAPATVAAPQPVATSPPTAPSDQTPQAAKRWYQRWWVWTVAAVVISGAGTAIAITSSGETKVRPGAGYDLRLRFP